MEVSLGACHKSESGKWAKEKCTLEESRTKNAIVDAEVGKDTKSQVFEVFFLKGWEFLRSHRRGSVFRV